MLEKILFLVVGIPMSIYAQENRLSQGIYFERGITWQQILDKAKAQDKYIFVDCYTTWCLPCKIMEQNVYPTKLVGEIYNEKFISVKLQIDRNYDDDSLVKKMYNEASRIQSDYMVTSFPTYLFFSSDGRPVHKAVGKYSPAEFIALAKDAFNPDKQYYNILNHFKPGILDTVEMRSLAYAVKRFDKELGGKIASDYINRILPDDISSPDKLKLMMDFNYNAEIQKKAINYISFLETEKLKNETERQFVLSFNNNKKVQEKINWYIQKLILQKTRNSNDIKFIAAFTKRKEDNSFSLFYTQGDSVDSIMKKHGYARVVVDRIIYINEIYPMLQLADSLRMEPKWTLIKDRIERKYSRLEYGERNVLEAKVVWYQYKKQWPQYLDNIVLKIDKYGPDSSALGGADVYINQIAWDGFFLHCNNKVQLERAISWMRYIVKKGGSHIASFTDTYANLLYKAGYVQDALFWEAKVVEMSPKNREFLLAYDRMKRGEPTWVNP